MMKPFLGYFDIETAPLSDAELHRILPPFNPDDVKLGPLKDEEKIRAKIAEAEATHFERFKADAALSPFKGRVIAIGLKKTGDKPQWVHYKHERRNLAWFWNLFEEDFVDYSFAGFNIREFDVPFLVRRSWRLGVKIPRVVLDLWQNRYKFPDYFTDLRDVWAFGQWKPNGSLNDLMEFFHLRPKPFSGAEFHEKSTVEQRKYLFHELKSMEKIAHYMGLNSPKTCYRPTINGGLANG